MSGSAPPSSDEGDRDRGLAIVPAPVPDEVVGLLDEEEAPAAAARALDPALALALTLAATALVLDAAAEVATEDAAAADALDALALDAPGGRPTRCRLRSPPPLSSAVPPAAGA